MKVQCPKCSAHYDVDKPGKYQCLQCQEVFTVEGEETTQAPELTPCPFCTAPVSPAARKCPHCGEWIKEKPKSRTIYLLLAFLMGNWGVAEFYVGRIPLAFLYFTLTIIGLVFSAIEKQIGLFALGCLFLIQFLLAMVIDIPAEREVKEYKQSTLSKIMYWFIWIISAIVFLGIAVVAVYVSQR